jgi:hypothetical protein
MGSQYHPSSMSSSPNTLNLKLHAKQWVARQTRATEVLYGGAAGGGPPQHEAVEPLACAMLALLEAL